MPRRPAPPPPDPSPPGARLRTLLIVLAAFFVLPAGLFLRVADTEGQGRVAVMILALTLPATGALILRLNPDLIPDRATLRRLGPGDLARLGALAVLLLAAVWWLTGLVGAG